MFVNRDIFSDSTDPSYEKLDKPGRFTIEQSYTDQGNIILNNELNHIKQHNINKLTQLRQLYTDKQRKLKSTQQCLLTHINHSIIHLHSNNNSRSNIYKSNITLTTQLINQPNSGNSIQGSVKQTTRTLNTITQPSIRSSYINTINEFNIPNINNNNNDQRASINANSPSNTSMNIDSKARTNNVSSSTTTTATTTNDHHASDSMNDQSAGLSQAEKILSDAGVSGTYDPVKPLPYRSQSRHSISMNNGLFSVKSLSTPFDIKQFILSYPPKNHLVQCYILRNKKGIANRLYPVYDVYLQENGQFMMSGKKKSQNKTSNYIISNTANSYDKSGTSYIGKVRSNFVGTEFVSYDHGINPKYVTPDDTVATLNVRHELASVFYESNILGSRGPRKMITLVPSVNQKNNQRAVWRPVGDSSGMIDAYKSNRDNDNFISLINKAPKWNDQVGAYVLNFNGRVTQASVKNFQLINESDPETVILQFGRVDKDHFTMDYCWPLSALQAFQICLSSFDYKLACE